MGAKIIKRAKVCITITVKEKMPIVPISKLKDGIIAQKLETRGLGDKICRGSASGSGTGTSYLLTGTYRSLLILNSSDLTRTSAVITRHNGLKLKAEFTNIITEPRNTQFRS